MDKEYRIALKKHLKTVFAETISDYKEKIQKTNTPQLVQTLFATPSIVSRSRIIDALIDTPMQSSRSSYDNVNDHNEAAGDTAHRDSSLKPHKNDFSNTTEGYHTMATSSPKSMAQRMTGGDDNANGCGEGPTPKSSQINLSLYTFDSTHTSSRSRTPSFRKRTARELSQMVLAECRLVESLNLIDTERSVRNDLPIVLWRTKKRKFNSSVDLHFDACLSDAFSHDSRHTGGEKSKVIPLPPPPTQRRSESYRNSMLDGHNNRHHVDHDDDDDEEDDSSILDAEGIIREKFTAPLIRHVERNYVRNITATADLLNLLERMPGDIDRALAEKCNK